MRDKMQQSFFKSVRFALRHGQRWWRAAGLVLGLLFLQGAMAQTNNYPSKPLRLIVPFPPGGPVDVIGRVTADVLSQALGQPVVVENRAGAGGVIGTDLVAKAPADGYTLGIGPISSLSITPAMGKKTPYNVDTDLTMVSLLGKVVGALVAHPGAPFDTLEQMIAYAKAHPGELTYASSGPGTSSHLAGEYLSARAGVKMVHVPYKGTAPAIQDLLGGQVPLYFETSLAAAAAMVNDKRLKALAITGPARSALLPGVATVAEQGFPGFDVSPWMALIAPAQLPEPLVEKLNKAVREGMTSPQVAKRLALIGGMAETSSPAEARKFVQNDTAHWRKLIKDANIRFD
ncbi:Bug family tripartite tricarboxylate transporter substrate binding protein [Hydrogenophaga electricum]|nr:tripartite tricarboxylate transporter substrate binding protein [Hydrogenophaga electricum]